MSDIKNLNSTGTCWTSEFTSIRDEAHYIILWSYKTAMAIQNVTSGVVYKMHETLRDFRMTTHKHCSKWNCGSWKVYDSLPMWKGGPISSRPEHKFQSKGYGKMGY